MDFEDAPVVMLGKKAIAIDYTMSPVICDVVCDGDNEYIDWDTADPIYWEDLNPTTYDIYHKTVEFLLDFHLSPSYTK